MTVSTRRLAAIEEAAEPFGKINPNNWHYCNIEIRRNGKDENYEADWLRGLWHAIFAPKSGRLQIAEALQTADEDYDDLAKQLWGMLDPREQETLLCLVKQGPVWDGDVPSKIARSNLIDLGLASKAIVKGEHGYQVATYIGWTVLKQGEEK